MLYTQSRTTLRMKLTGSDQETSSQTQVRAALKMKVPADHGFSFDIYRTHLKRTVDIHVSTALDVKIAGRHDDRGGRTVRSAAQTPRPVEVDISVNNKDYIAGKYDIAGQG